MKGLGYLLLSAGFVVAAYATALDVEHVSWALFGAAVLAAVSGVVALKRYARSIAQSEDVLENNRAELRERISEILNPDQRARYLEIVAEISGRQSSRGRVFVLDEAGKPRPVQVRTGLSDGSFTEVSGEGIKEGDTVVIGLVSATGASAPPPRQSAPRLPF